MILRAGLYALAGTLAGAFAVVVLGMILLTHCTLP
jgi:hypothetical protein